jgi:hypothetical protein
MSISSVSNTYAAQQAYSIKNNSSSIATGTAPSGSSTVSNTGDSVTISEAAYKALQAATQTAVASASSSSKTYSSQASSSVASSASQASLTSSGSSSYDFTNMTPNQMLTTVNSLIKSGKMSLDESSSLVGMMGASPLNNANGSTGAPASANMPTNFISSLHNMISFDTSIGDTYGVAYAQKALFALNSLQGTSVTDTGSPSASSTPMTLNDSIDTSSNGLKKIFDHINSDPKFANEMAESYANSIDLKKIPLVDGHLPLPTDSEAWAKLTQGQEEFQLQADTVREQRIQIYNNMKASGASGAEIYKNLMAFNKTLPEDYLSNSGTDRFLKYF